MMKSTFKIKIFILSSCLIISVALIIILFFASFKPYYDPDSFKRLILSDIIALKSKLNLKYNSYYISGVTTKTIYLANSVAPQYILKVDEELKDTQYMTLTVNNPANLSFHSIKIKTDSPYFFILDGYKPQIFVGSLNSQKADKCKFRNLNFSSSAPISSRTLAIRTLNKKNEFVLAKCFLNSDSILLANNLLEKQGDGLFSTDGMLNYDSHTSKLVYVYYYRNQFLCLDTNLNLNYKGKTIDTISHAQINIGKISSENAVAISRPPLMVNNKSFVSDGLLFINSNIISKTDNKRAFKNSTVIDVYDLTTGKYKFSFYIPDLENEKVKNLEFMGDCFVVLYDRHLVKYQLNKKLLH